MHLRDTLLRPTQTLRDVRRRIPVRRQPPRGTRALLRLFEETQWWPIERIRNYQLERLRALVTHAAENVPYYRDLFRDIGIRPEDLRTLDDLRHLPLLEKQSVRRSWKRLAAKDQHLLRPVVRHTGGSTGQHLEVLMSERAQHAHQAEKLRYQAWAGWRPGDRVARFELFEGPDPMAPCYLDRSRNLLDFNALHFTPEALADMTSRLARFRPDVIIAFPSHLYWICRFLAAHPRPEVRPRTLLTSCEMLYDFQRREIERFFDAKVFDYYGMAEHAASASQCEAGSYHLGVEYAFIEVLRPDGTPAQPGETGEIVGTNFENYAMPLIRYRTGDLATPALASCPCGRTLPVLQQVAGRTQDIVVTPDGVTVFPHRSFDFDRVPTVKELQIIQEDVHRFRVLATVTPEYRDEDGREIGEILRRGLGYPVRAEVEPVRHIPRSLRGKSRLVICRVPAAVWTGETNADTIL